MIPGTHNIQKGTLHRHSLSEEPILGHPGLGGADRLADPAIPTGRPAKARSKPKTRADTSLTTRHRRQMRRKAEHLGVRGRERVASCFASSSQQGTCCPKQTAHP